MARSTVRLSGLGERSGGATVLVMNVGYQAWVQWHIVAICYRDVTFCGRAGQRLPLPPGRLILEGFRSLFDGVSLKGWKRSPRALNQPSLGIWTVENGVITGGQDPPGSGIRVVSGQARGNVWGFRDC